ncbi:hypothetical protein H0H93_007051, partial [Arthromyces matolae]
IGSDRNIAKAHKANENFKKQAAAKAKKGKAVAQNDEGESEVEDREEKNVRMTKLEKQMRILQEYKDTVDLNEIKPADTGILYDSLESACFGFTLYPILHDTALGNCPELQHYQLNPRRPERADLDKMALSTHGGGDIRTREPTTALWIVVDKSMVDESTVSWNWKDLQKIRYKDEWKGKLASEFPEEKRKFFPTVGNGGHRTAFFREHHQELLKIHATFEALLEKNEEKRDTRAYHDLSAECSNAKQEVNSKVWAARMYDRAAIEEHKLGRLMLLMIGANKEMYSVMETPSNVFGMCFDYINSIQITDPTPKHFEKAIDVLVSSTTTNHVRKVLSDHSMAVGLRRLYQNPIIRQSLPFSLKTLTNVRGVLSVYFAPLMHFMALTFEFLTSNHPLAAVPLFVKGNSIAKVQANLIKFNSIPYEEKQCRPDIFETDLHDVFEDPDKEFSLKINMFGVTEKYLTPELLRAQEEMMKNYEEKLYVAVEKMINEQRDNFKDDKEATAIIDSLINKLHWFVKGQIAPMSLIPTFATPLPIMTPTVVRLIISQIDKYKHIFTQILTWYEPLTYLGLNDQDHASFGTESSFRTILEEIIVRLDPKREGDHAATINTFLATCYSHRLSALESIYELHQQTIQDPKKTHIPYFKEIHISRTSKDPIGIAINTTASYLLAYIDHHLKPTPKSRDKKNESRSNLADLERRVNAKLVDSIMTSTQPPPWTIPALMPKATNRTNNLRKWARVVVFTVWAAYPSEDINDAPPGYDVPLFENEFVQMFLEDIAGIIIEGKKDKEGNLTRPFRSWYDRKEVAIDVVKVTAKIKSIVCDSTTSKTVDILVKQCNSFMKVIKTQFMKKNPLTTVSVIDKDGQPQTVLKYEFHKLLESLQEKLTDQLFNAAKHVHQNPYDFRLDLSEVDQQYILNRMDSLVSGEPIRESYTDLESWYAPKNMETFANPNLTVDAILQTQRSHRLARDSQMKKLVQKERKFIALTERKLQQ